MVIQTLERGFAVIRVINSTEEMDVFLCRDKLTGTEELYMLLCLKNPELIYRTLPFFASQKNNHAFDDFEGCFSQHGKFYAIFRHHEKQLLLERAENGELFLLEKLEIARNLTGKMAIQNMPACIQYEALHWENLMVDDSLSVYFKYGLKEVSIYNLISFSSVQTELADVMRILFDKEIATRICPELITFIEKLEEGLFEDYMGIYGAYDKVRVKMKSMLETGTVEPQSFLFRLWNGVKRAATHAKPIAAGLVIAVAFGFLIYTLVNPPVKASAVSGVYIEQIGTVKVE